MDRVRTSVPLQHKQIKRGVSSQHSAATALSPNLYVLNVNSIAKPHALDHLQADLISYASEVAVITETHLKKKHAQGVETIPGYVAYRRDRAGRRGGGVAIYVREDFTSERCEFNIDSDLELLWIKLKQPACTVPIGVIYHPPKLDPYAD